MIPFKSTFSMFVLILVLVSCKKQSDTYTTVTWEVKNPVTEEGYSGVPVSLFKLRNGSGATEIWSGLTDENGEAEYQFKAYNSNNYKYRGSADLSGLGVQGLDYSILSQPSPGTYLYKNKNNTISYSAVPYGEYVQHTKNISCQGPDDKMRLRKKYIFTGSGNNDFSDWFPNEELNGFSYIEGCYENISNSPIEIRSDSILFEIEVTKNNITDTIYEKFYVGPDQVDTIKIYY